MTGSLHAAMLVRQLRESRTLMGSLGIGENATSGGRPPASLDRIAEPDDSVSGDAHATWPTAIDANASDADRNWSETYNATVDVLHGYPYPSLYSWQHIIISSVVVTVIMLVIILGNTLVIVAVATDRNLKGVQNWFITSLAVSDLLVGLFIMPLSLANELMGYWIFGDVLCELWLAIDVLLCTASILNLCLISLDRYWSVTRAVSYVKTRTRKRAIIMIAIVWLLSMIICFPPLVGWKRPQPTKYGYPLCVLSEEPGYVAYSTIGSFYIPLIVMVLVYFKIYLAARSRARRNLKSRRTPAKSVPENGRTSSTTTTSFSNQCRIDPDLGKLTPTKEFSSEDDPSAAGSGQHSSQSGSQAAQHAAPEPEAAGNALRPPDAVTGNPPTPGSDEKRQLLSGDETDSTTDASASRNKTGNEPGRHIFFSEDTDSHSDVNNPSSQVVPEVKVYRERSGAEENLKPLLEESDSQRDSDKNSNSLVLQSTLKPASALPVTQLTHDGAQSGERHAPQAAHHPGLLKASLPPHLIPSPAQIKRHLGGTLVRKSPKDASRSVREDPERFKRKIARAKERRATIVLGIIMATFISCWLPFFSIYLVVSFAHLSFPPMAFAVFFWFGYVNSALNPIIYTIFNRDFKNAFHKIIFGRKKNFWLTRGS